jgi:dolichyl-diphosphooligosaccharide---protein glycosyltransferase subunit 1 (ribophorin I)
LLLLFFFDKKIELEMTMKSVVVLVVSVLLLASVSLAYDVDEERAKHSKVRVAEALRVVDLQTQVGRQRVSLKYRNDGESELSTLFFSLEDEQAERLSLIEAEFEREGKSNRKLQVRKVADKKYLWSSSDSSSDSESLPFRLFEIKLRAPLEANGGEISLLVSLYFTHVMRPWPATMKQGDPQLMLFDAGATVYLHSPYPVDSQRTTVMLALSPRLRRASVESATDVAPFSREGAELRYGAYEGIEALQGGERLRVHFETSAPFAVVTRLMREVEVSHWGNVAFEEHFDVEHQGAALQGSFSRMQFQRNPMAHTPVVLQFIEKLPDGARDVYYRDIIGNISTSHLSYRSDGATLELEPRFPLFGGWKTQFYVGYSAPLENHVSRSTSTDKYVLRAPFCVDVNDLVVDDYELRVILPEGATNIELVAPFSVDSKAFDTRVTYLDTTGRPMLVVRKHNLIQHHQVDFHVLYDFPATALYRDPLLLIGAVFIVLLAVIVCTRVDLSLGSTASSSSLSASTKRRRRTKQN